MENGSVVGPSDRATSRIGSSAKRHIFLSIDLVERINTSRAVLAAPQTKFGAQPKLITRQKCALYRRSVV
jgi:hypothetical protein